MTELAITGAALGRIPGVEVHGEVDLGTVPELSAALDAAILDSVGAFVVDLTDVRFLDSSGLNALLRARALLGRQDRALILICPDGHARRVFELAGVVDLFPLYETRAAAAGELTRAR